MRFNSETFDIMNKCEEYDGALLHNGKCTYTHFQGNRGNDQGRGQKLQVCLSPPPYSPGLNPIEQFWVLIKAKAKPHQLEDTEALEELIYLHNIIQHLKNQFNHYLNETLI